MNKLHAFGDSFTFGTDLKDCNINPSNITWPALLAEHKSMDYVCYAFPGSSNQTIVREFFDNLHSIDKDDFVVVNWTWINRWDFYNTSDNKWENLRPDSTNSIFYKDYIKYFQSELWDKLETLKAINLLHTTLKSMNIRFISTCVDELILDTVFHAPPYIKNLQNNIKEEIVWFDNMGFYNWAKENNYKISNKWHPLEEAHRCAFEYIVSTHE